MLEIAGADDDLLSTGSVSADFEDLDVSPGGSCVKKLGRELSDGCSSDRLEFSTFGSMAMIYKNYSETSRRDLANTTQHDDLVKV